MSLRKAISSLGARARAWPRLPSDPIALPRAARRLEQRLARSRHISAEEAQALLERVRSENPARLSAADLRRALEPAWKRWQDEASHAEWLQDLTRAALALNRRSVDRRIISSWIQVFPAGSLASILASAAEQAAERHSWAYRDAGRRFHLWDRSKGPAALGRAMLQQGDLAAVLRQAGIPAVQVASGLVQAALGCASDDVAEASEGTATAACTTLLALMEQLGQSSILAEARPWTVRALLRPWRDKAPPPELKARIQKHLISVVGDPRLSPTPWHGIETAWRSRGDHEDAQTLRLVLKRWLVSASFETFFRVMGRTTENPIQWRARENFWREYLEGGHVQEAWFILGHEAERQLHAYHAELQEAGGFGRFDGGATPSHSALLMQIGDVMIAEWTHNGSCCFWQRNAVNRPTFYNDRYDGRYMRNSEAMRAAAARQARELGAEPLWQALSHHDGWESRFRQVIRDLTGIRA